VRTSPPQPSADLRRDADRLLLRASAAGLGWSTALVLATALGAVVVLARPAAMAAAVDAATSSDRSHAGAVAWFAVVTGAVLASAVVAQLTEACGVARITSWLRLRLVDHALALGLRGQARFPAGDLASRVVTAAPHAAGLTPLVVDTVAGIVLALGSAVALWLIDWRIVVALALAAPVGVVVASLLVQSTAALATDYQRAQADVAGRLLEAQRGARTIRASDTLGQEVERVLAPLPRIAAAGRAMWDVLGLSAGRVGLVGPVVHLVALAVAGHGVAAGRVSPGQLLAAIGYIPMALGLLDGIGSLADLGAQRASARRLTEVLTVPVPPPGRCPLPDGPGELRFAGVTVRAGGSPVLDGIDLVVPGGSSMAVVGRSGAGKSTLARLAGRLADPDEGSVSLDGVPLDELDVQALRDAVAHAFERPALLGTTVADAITYGAPGAVRRGDVEAAATVARADGFIGRLPCRYDTALDVVPMSGGERQRLGLARAVARAGRVLVMDDATSSLDTVTEAQVTGALARVAQGRTRVVVAHRAGTAARCDAVVWLEAGRVRGVASHAELWSDPAYRAVFGAGVDEPAGDLTLAGGR
jgi:ATP-binding cassette, subfamily B, bacterial